MYKSTDGKEHFYLDGYTQPWDMSREPSENKNKASGEAWFIEQLPDGTCRSEKYWLFANDNAYPFNENIRWGVREEIWEDVGCDGRVDRISFDTEFMENSPYSITHETNESADREIFRDKFDQQFKEKRDEFARHFGMSQRNMY